MVSSAIKKNSISIGEPYPYPDKPEPNTFYVWPQKTPFGRELGAERQNNTEVKNLFQRKSV
jgi:hypothetical protein